MPRQARLDAVGALHHIMVRGINKSAIFEDDQDSTRFLERLGRTVIEGKCTVYAWALMSNHVHILFKSGKDGLSAVMRKLLTWYALYFNRSHGRSGHLFENRYKSILCDEENYLLALVRYIHLNPLRAAIACRSSKELGLSGAEIARHLGVNTSSINRAIGRHCCGITYAPYECPQHSVPR